MSSLENQKKVNNRYSTIETYDESKHASFLENSWIIIREKIDGSNVQIERIGNKLVVGSRDLFLNESFHLSGAFQYVQKMDVENFIEGLIYFGEWIVPYRLHYQKDFYTMRLFSIAKNKKEYQYLSMVSKSTYETLQKKSMIENAPILYEGPFISMEHIESFIGKTKMVEPLESESTDDVIGEGIVVSVYSGIDKNTLLTFPTTRPVMFKLVAENFKERKLKIAQPETNMDKITQFVFEVATEARIKKRFLDQITLGVFPEVLSNKDLGLVMKTLPTIVLDDIMKEHGEEYQILFDAHIEEQTKRITELLGEEKAKSIPKDTKKHVQKMVTNSVLSFIYTQIKN